MRPAVALSFLALLLFLSLPCSSHAAAAPQILRGHVPAITRRLKPIDRLESNRQLDLAIGLPLRNREQLTNLLSDLSRPSSPNFRHFLTPDQFAASFGPTESDYQSVINFAKAHNLAVKQTHPNRALLDVRGSVADIENAFHVKMRVYQHPTENRLFYAPDSEPTLDLETPVLAISGLDNYVKPRPQLRPPNLARPAIHPLGGGGSSGGGGGGGSGSGGLFIGYDFRNAYAPGVTLDGEGQSIALFELSGYDDNDITAYEDEAGLPYVPMQNILIDGFDGDDTNIDYAVEVTADIEMSAAMAPGLDNIYVYEGPTPLYETPLETNFIQYASTTAQINDTLQQIATDDFAHQVSCSYEMDINASTIQIFQQFAAQGQSFFQGSGDSGAYPGVIDEPADDPYLTIVGGTTLSTTGAGGSWVSDVVWLTPASSDPLLGNSPEQATGGGVSFAYPIPTWQQGVSMSANQGSTTMRNLPDVAMVANNVDVVWGDDYGIQFDFPEAGTSLATPLWAGFMALVNQQAAANRQPPVGFANPAIYAIGRGTNYQNCFHDVTSGNNFSPNSPSKYSAAVGYDLCSGWGTPTGSNLISALLAPPAEDLLVTPPLGFLSLGPGGGPFTVNSRAYTLSNISSAVLPWSVVNTSRWLSVSSTSGSLNPGASASVTVSLNGSANTFLIASPDANVSFVNNNDSSVQNREFDLYVGNGGFEAGDLSDWKLSGDTNLVFALSADDADIAGTNALYGAADVDFVHSGIYGAYLGEFPDDGALAQTVSTTPGQQYLVSFYLTSVAYYGVTAPNNFSATWNGSILYAATNLPVVPWTNIQSVVTAASSSATLQFNFRNDPAGFGLDDISVTSLSPPVPILQSATVTANAVLLTWSGVTGSSYQVQSTATLTAPNWSNLLAPITASNDTVTISAPLPAAPQQFYRVLQLPSSH